MRQKIKIKTVSLCILIGLIMTLLNGCAKVNQLHERLIVQGIGIDSVDDNYEVTMHVFDDINTGADEAEKIEVLTGTGGSVLDALTNVSLRTGREPLFSQNLILVIGNQAAKNGLDNILDFFIRYYEARPSVSVFVSHDSAKSVMTSEYNNLPVTAMKISSLASAGELSGKFLESNIVDVINCLCGNLSDPCLMALKVESSDSGENIIADSTAIFNKNTLVDFLNLNQTRGLLLLTSKVNGGTFSVNMDEQNKATLMFDKVNSKPDIYVENDKIRIVSNIYAETDLYSLDGDIKNKYPSEYLSEIEAAAANILKENCMSAINRAIFDLNSDIFNFGKLVRLKHPDYFRNIESDWHTVMKDVDYEVNVNVSISKIGQEMKPV